MESQLDITAIAFSQGELRALPSVGTPNISTAVELALLLVEGAKYDAKSSNLSSVFERPE